MLKQLSPKHKLDYKEVRKQVNCGEIGDRNVNCIAPADGYC